METTTAKNVTRNSKLQEFFIDQLEDIYWAEQKLVKTLPKLEESAHSEDLKQAFNNHLQETKNHVSRLEKVFDLIGEPAQAKKCHAISGIIDEGEDIIDETNLLGLGRRHTPRRKQQVERTRRTNQARQQPRDAVFSDQSAL